MNKLSEKIIPLTMIVTGLYFVVIPYIFRMSEPFYHLMPFFSEVMIITGIMIYVIQFISKRLTRIEQHLEINNENKVGGVSLIPSENHISFIEQLKKNRFVYKASIYLPNSKIENLFLLRSFLNATKLDSRARIIINVQGIDKTARKNIEEITTKYHNQIEIKGFSSENDLNFSIVILDTTVWVLTNFGAEIRNNLVFNVSSYSEQGKSFIDFYNKIWGESEVIKSVENEN